MEKKYVILVTATSDRGCSEFHGGEYKNHPTEEEIKEAINYFREKDWIVHYAKVEKRFFIDK